MGEMKEQESLSISTMQEAVQETEEQASVPDPQRLVQEIEEQARLSEEEEEAVQEMTEQEETGSKFRPKASVLPPSPSQEEAQTVNPLDVKPGMQVIEGKVTDWRGKFGFMISDQMEGKIFLHSKDFVEGRQLARVGATAFFQVLHQESSVVGAKAVNVRIFE